MVCFHDIVNQVAVPEGISLSDLPNVSPTKIIVQG